MKYVAPSEKKERKEIQHNLILSLTFTNISLSKHVNHSPWSSKKKLKKIFLNQNKYSVWLTPYSSTHFFILMIRVISPEVWASLCCCCTKVFFFSIKIILVTLQPPKLPELKTIFLPTDQPIKQCLQRTWWRFQAES